MSKRLFIVACIFILPMVLALYSAFGVNKILITNALMGFLEIYTLFAIITYLQKRFHLRILITFIAFFLLLMYVSQSISLYLTREFIIPLAVANVGSIFLILPIWQLIIICVLLLAVSLVIERYIMSDKDTLKGKYIFFLLMVLLIGNRLEYTPTYKLIRSYRVALKISNLAVDYYTIASSYNALLEEYNKEHGNVDKEFPLYNTKTYTKNLEFPVAEKENVIIFFQEGVSTHLIGTYGSSHPDITPNIDAFANDPHVMQVKNIFNHTAATFRGIAGTLNSNYPLLGGRNYSNQRESNNFLLRDQHGLVDILNARGYTSSFFHPHTEHHFSGYIKSLQFDNVFSSEYQIEHFLYNNPKFDSKCLSDEGLYKSIVEYLKNMPENEKFFIGSYIIGTHAFNNVTSDGVKYPHKDAMSLNTMHNADVWFGEFWEYFKNSPFYENTYVIFTTDHAHFQETPYLEVVNAPYPIKYFVDTIPLLVYAPHGKLPKTFDAQNRTSLDTTPTLLHLLGYNDPNTFLGHSLFEEQQENYAIALLGLDAYKIKGPGNIEKVSFDRLPKKFTTKVNLHRVSEYRKQLMPESKL